MQVVKRKKLRDSMNYNMSIIRIKHLVGENGIYEVYGIQRYYRLMIFSYKSKIFLIISMGVVFEILNLN